MVLNQSVPAGIPRGWSILGERLLCDRKYRQATDQTHMYATCLNDNTNDHFCANEPATASSLVGFLAPEGGVTYVRGMYRTGTRRTGIGRGR